MKTKLIINAYIILFKKFRTHRKCMILTKAFHILHKNILFCFSVLIAVT